MRARSQSRLTPLTFFLDRNLGKQTIAAALRQAGVDVQIHDDHFRQDATDVEWLREVGRQGWIVLTKDKRIRHRSHERTTTRHNIDTREKARQQLLDAMENRLEEN